MRNHKPIMTGVVAAALLVAAGFGTGYYFNARKAADIAAQDAAPAQPEKPAYNHTTYDISPPSRGAALKIFPVTLHPLADGVATIPLSVTEAADIKTGQQVLLYDANNTMMETFGTVSGVAVNPGQPETVSVTLFTGNDADFPAPPVRGEIILGRRNDAQRLPHAAIVRDKKTGEPYVWETNKNIDGTTQVFYKRTNLIMETPAFVVVETPAYKSNVFVLNPDDALADGQTINTIENLYSAPPLTPDQVIAARMEALHPAPPGPDPYTGPDFPSACSLTTSGDPVPGAMSLPVSTP